MNETPAGIEQVRALVAAFRDLGARSINIYESASCRLIVNVEVTSDDAVTAVAARMGMPHAKESRVEMAHQPGVEFRWLSSWSHNIDGMIVEISGPHTAVPAPSVTHAEVAA